MEKMATNNRIPFVDALKGFAILLVVMGHLQGIISFLASILIIAISFCVINLVSKSNILRKIFFGK